MRIAGLIFDFRFDLLRLDPAAMESVVPVTGGFDDVFGEPLPELATGAVKMRTIRREMAAIRIPCQVEPDSWEALRMFDAGSSNGRDVVLTTHFDDLKRLGLVDSATGAPLIRMGDRLDGIYDRAGRLVRKIGNPPGLYVNELHEDSFGMSLRAPRRQLLIISFSDRQQAMETTS